MPQTEAFILLNRVSEYTKNITQITDMPVISQMI
jgi:hypothetical protein